ncbi:MAG: hypothetical protein DWG76_00545 [Chloroflexi bacterium]|nr:protein kinase [Chloroflexota bacterium]MQC25926.1 hypothetical protein [Chloroflexota bacterium]
MDDSQKPAHRLLGVDLEDGWRVIEKINRDPKGTGGYFSVSYVIERGKSDLAFLKALDLSTAFEHSDPAGALNEQTDAFVFERDLLLAFRGKYLDRIVSALAHGTFFVDPPPPPPFNVVQYIIFELADGDVRKLGKHQENFNLAWCLRSLHHMATGLAQMHGREVAHQDLKPSNVLVFDDVESKLADLGRASAQGKSPPHEDRIVPGDRTYAPFELLYKQVDPDWYRRRMGNDSFLLGSMVVFSLRVSA